MCQPISWKEKNGVLVYLTTEDIKSKRMQEFKAYNKQWSTDIMGHGAIDFFYPDAKGAKQSEVNFPAPPSAYPAEIADAMKAGKFRGVFAAPELLSVSGKAEYDKVVATAWAECDKVKATATAEYDKVIMDAFWGVWANKENRVEEWR